MKTKLNLISTVTSLFTSSLILVAVFFLPSIETCHARKMTRKERNTISSSLKKMYPEIATVNLSKLDIDSNMDSSTDEFSPFLNTLQVEITENDELPSLSLKVSSIEDVMTVQLKSQVQANKSSQNIYFPELQQFIDGINLGESFENSYKSLIDHFNTNFVFYYGYLNLDRVDIENGKVTKLITLDITSIYTNSTNRNSVNKNKKGEPIEVIQLTGTIKVTLTPNTSIIEKIDYNFTKKLNLQNKKVQQINYSTADMLLNLL